MEGVAPSAAGSARRRSWQAALRWGFLLASLVAAGWAVVARWDQIVAAWQQAEALPLAGAFLLGAAGVFAAFQSWRWLMKGFGSPLAIAPSSRVFFLGQLGKYLPGGMWSVVAQTSLGRDHGVPRSRVAGASLVAIAVGIITAGLLSLLLLLSARDLIGDYWWVLLAVVPLVLGLHPGLLDRLVRLIARLTGRSVELPRLRERDLLSSISVQTAGQLILGAQLWVLVYAFGGTWIDPLLAVGLFSLAATAGSITIFAPAGIGVRETVLALGLSPFIDAGAVVLVVLASRIMLLLADLGYAGLTQLVFPARRLR